MPDLSSFGSGFHAVVIGASGGIGGAFADVLASNSATLHRFSRPALDLTDEASIEAAAAEVKAVGPLHLVIVATGLLHDAATGLGPEKSLRDIDAAAFERVFAINTTGPALIAKHFAPLLDRNRKSVFAALSARVGSVSDNKLGGWYAYRASKSALNMILMNSAIEVGRRNKQAVFAGLQPGTVDTGLSQPFQGAVPDGGLFTPQQSAEKLLTVLNGLTPEDSGGLFDHSGARIPF